MMVDMHCVIVITSAKFGDNPLRGLFRGGGGQILPFPIDVLTTLLHYHASVWYCGSNIWLDVRMKEQTERWTGQRDSLKT